tara:strand:- start:243 stop:437 length:195 start_codon:yes stop_codon:yes gene_type:complete
MLNKFINRVFGNPTNRLKSIINIILILLINEIVGEKILYIDGNELSLLFVITSLLFIQAYINKK